MSKSSFIFVVLPLVIIIGLLAVIIFRQPQPALVIDNEKVLRDSLTLLQTKIDASEVRQVKIQKAYDSLSLIEPAIIYRTHDKVKFIFTDATPNDLDSIIRANWKTTSGYR